MEPFDIDKFIKAKLEEPHDLHRSEIEAAKPFVWSAVQKNAGGHRTLTWVHLAAAVIILLISFSFILFSLQEKHQQELSAIQNKMNKLESNYLSQLQTVELKDAQVKSLADNVKQLEAGLSDLRLHKTVVENTKVVYRTDTIYVKQTEYITKVTNPSAAPISNDDVIDLQPQASEPALAQNTQTDDVIFVGYSKPNTSQTSESVKLKIGSFGSNKN